MLNPIWIVARKEIVDCLRDVRSLAASLAYTLMGPAVVYLVSLGEVMNTGSAAQKILPAMLSVFALVSAFTGGMNVAMDLVAGERERRSLLPLLLNAVDRQDVLIGKWLAVGFFAVVGFALNLAGSVVVLASAGTQLHADAGTLIAAAAGLLSLPLFAASLELLLSTGCRSVKEAQTYLSMAVFVPMGIGFFGVFFAGAAGSWGWYVPLLGQQLQLEAIMSGGHVAMMPAAVAGGATLLLAALALQLAANRLRRDEIVYAS